MRTRKDLLTASRGNPVMRETLDDIYSRLEAVEKVTTPPAAPPKGCQFTVTGQDGNFIVQITNPEYRTYLSNQQRYQYQQSGDTNYLRSTVTHELQSSTTRLFDASGDVRTYGPDQKVRWEITDTPDQSRYWRVRSSYDGGKTWNNWKEYTDPAVCGIMPVWSGAVRSVRQMPNAQLRTTNYATVDSVLDGGTATIRVYGSGGPGTGWIRQVGSSREGLSVRQDGTIVPFPSAELHGYALDTHYEVYYDKQYNLYRVFTDAQHAETLDDRFRFCGGLTTGTNGGTDAEATATVSGGAVIQVSVTVQGSGYVTAPAVSFTGGGGADASAYATISGGKVISVTITSGGSGYVSAPTVVFTGGHSGTVGGGGDDGSDDGNPINYKDPARERLTI